MVLIKRCAFYFYERTRRHFRTEINASATGRPSKSPVEFRRENGKRRSKRVNFGSLRPFSYRNFFCAANGPGGTNFEFTFVSPPVPYSFNGDRLGDSVVRALFLPPTLTTRGLR